MKAWFKNLFIPCAENSYAPHSLQKMAMGGMTVLIILTFTLTNVQSLLWIASDWMVSTILPAVIVQETNKERAVDALPTLRRNSVLDEAARLKAEHMAANEYFAHYSPDGVSPWYWFGQTGYNFVHAGENLAIHFTDSTQVVDAWMKSPTHRANIMNGDYLEIGVGTAAGKYEGFSTVYVVQLFGAPVAGLPAVAGDETSGVAVAAEPEPSPAETTPPPTSVAVAAPPPEPAPEQPVTQSVATEAEAEDVLADEVTVTETVEIVPSEPMPQFTDLADIQVTETGVAAFSDFISTSTGGVPATIDSLPPEDGESVPRALGMLTQPHIVLQLMYGIIGFFVLVSLIFSIFIEIRHQQPVQIVYGFVLLLLMSGLFYLHTVLSTGVVIA